MSAYQYFTFLHVILTNWNVYKSFVHIIFGLIFVYFTVIVMFIESIKSQVIIVIINVLKLFVCVIYVFITLPLLFIQTYNLFYLKRITCFCQSVFKFCLLMSCFCWFLSNRSSDIRVLRWVYFETYIVSHRRCYGNTAKVTKALLRLSSTALYGVVENIWKSTGTLLLFFLVFFFSFGYIC